MNHHLSIVRTRVPDKYLRDLTSGSDADLDEPLAQLRSPWYDLLTINGRLEAMRAIWGVLGWLLREGPDGSSDSNSVGS